MEEAARVNSKPRSSTDGGRFGPYLNPSFVIDAETGKMNHYLNILQVTRTQALTTSQIVIFVLAALKTTSYALSRSTTTTSQSEDSRGHVLLLKSVI
ncbi:hypothetical protein OESDEN_02151 [Oesophagostomum dentatum]|uniref:Uncharacterized protein n=1 Tax=Oesophagostomum dentatum TaxID=61180 RepID=A0A0B1TKT4_OESDE|nr:hypothetical protein OESDEN_02151 [Oesophagostomum dentatum]